MSQLVFVHDVDVAQAFRDSSLADINEVTTSVETHILGLHTSEGLRKDNESDSTASTADLPSGAIAGHTVPQVLLLQKSEHILRPPPADFSQTVQKKMELEDVQGEDQVCKHFEFLPVYADTSLTKSSWPQVRMWEAMQALQSGDYSRLATITQTMAHGFPDAPEMLEESVHSGLFSHLSAGVHSRMG